MNLDEARAIYKKAKLTADLASQEWVRLYDTAIKRPQIGARCGDTSEVITIATVARNVPHDDEELLFNAPDLLRAAIMVAEHAFDVIREQRQKIEKFEGRARAEADAKNYAENCAMLCTEPAFKVFLEECTGLERPLTDARVETHVRFLLDVPSRAVLNTNPAAQRWLNLRDDYDAWRKL